VGPEGRIRWCWLELGNAALMLQEYWRATLPFVGNRMWVTTVTDPHGYRLEFESPTDEPEESVYSDQTPRAGVA